MYNLYAYLLLLFCFSSLSVETEMIEGEILFFVFFFSRF